jgi:hypothetical protein
LSHGLHALDCGCFLGVRNEAAGLAIEHDVEAERPLAAAIDALRGQMPLGVADALAQPIALALGHRGEDREHHL